MTTPWPAQGAIPGRPNRALVVRCGYDGSTRRVTFPSAATCRLDSLRMRVEEGFSLSAWRFNLAYTDDDGEEFMINTEEDLTEAIGYFVSGDDDMPSTYGGADNFSNARSMSQKITLRVEVVVEYDGPSLSDASSISSFGSSQRSWNSRSQRHSQVNGSQDYVSSRGDSASIRSVDRASIASGRPPSAISQRDDVLSRRMSNLSMTQAEIRPSTSMDPTVGPSHIPGVPMPAGVRRSSKDVGPPSLLTHSELGSRWLREQSKLATRMPPRIRPVRTVDSDSEDDLDSDDESRGDIELVRDARGHYYYSYQTDSSSSSSRFDVDHDSSHGASRQSQTSPPGTNPYNDSPPSTLPENEVARAPSSEPAGPPILAPDCSACGVRLDYMRYVCVTCGEGDMWTENAVGKAPFVPPRVPSESDQSEDTTSSGSTAWAGAPASSQGTSQGATTAYRGSARTARSRSDSISTNTSLSPVNGSAASPSSPRSISFELETNGKGRASGRPSAVRGYELCPGCIEVHGIAHAKAASKQERAAQGTNRRRGNQLRHAFREKLWSAEGWVDVEYNEESRCTICHSGMFHNRYKCVSCPKFDLCRSCFQRVEEIHPIHVFLSLPDQPLPLIAPSESNGSLLAPSRQSESRPLRHPGAFCHNCLQDIVGPRFHCAVCPSWDLCIQCEGSGITGQNGGQHTADHIMMKIPVPLPTAAVEAVSRRARERWFQQDSSTVAANGATQQDAPSSYSSSPPFDTETVYAPTGDRGHRRQATATTAMFPHLLGNNSTTGRSSPASTSTNSTARVVARDDLDHNARCNCCNMWIMGRRYQCANCPSDPEPYNLCSICELRSYAVHDPRHVFFKFDRPVDMPLRSRRPFLPLLYTSRVGRVPANSPPSRDQTAYLRHVLHKETLCDVHYHQIRGVWLRCAHCASYDICQEAEQAGDHDPTHVFVVFKARVNMAAFRELCNLQSDHPSPILTRQVYMP